MSATPDRRVLSFLSRVRPAARLATVCAAGVVAACGGRDAADEARDAQRREARELGEQAARLASGDTSRRLGRDSSLRISLGSTTKVGIARGEDPPLGAGDVRVTSTDGMLVLALVGDTVRTRLGDSAVAKMRRDMADDADTASGFGGLVARTVKGAVAGSMSEIARFSLRVPADDVRDLRYENGQLSFRTGKDSQTNARFAPEDAERFIAAVRARQARPAGR